MRSLGLAAAMVIAALAACSSIDTPPPHWPAPKPAAADQCPDLSGSYRNAGTDVKGSPAPPLAFFLFAEAAKTWTATNMETGRKFASASHVDIRGPGMDGLVIEIWKDRDLLKRIERKAVLDDGFGCGGGALSVSLPVMPSADMGVFFDTFRKAAIAPASDGSILVRRSSTGFGLGFYLVPVGMQFDSWSLYRATGRESPPATAVQ